MPLGTDTRANNQRVNPSRCEHSRDTHQGFLFEVPTQMCWAGTVFHLFASTTRDSASTRPNPYKWLTGKKKVSQRFTGFLRKKKYIFQFCKERISSANTKELCAGFFFRESLSIDVLFDPFPFVSRFSISFWFQGFSFFSTCNKLYLHSISTSDKSCC